MQSYQWLPQCAYHCAASGKSSLIPWGPIGFAPFVAPWLPALVIEAAPTLALCALHSGLSPSCKFCNKPHGMEMDASMFAQLKQSRSPPRTSKWSCKCGCRRPHLTQCITPILSRKPGHSISTEALFLFSRPFESRCSFRKPTCSPTRPWHPSVHCTESCTTHSSQCSEIPGRHGSPGNGGRSCPKVPGMDRPGRWSDEKCKGIMTAVLAQASPCVTACQFGPFQHRSSLIYTAVSRWPGEFP